VGDTVTWKNNDAVQHTASKTAGPGPTFDTGVIAAGATSALLLPRGKVMAAGGAPPGGCSLSAFNTIEVFSPPYLFRGARPAITALPGLVHHGQSFEITTPDADDVARVVLVRPMAVTHQTDSEQRVVTLRFARTAADRLAATMPDGVHPHGMAPRGYYLLSILKANGVPSEGRFIYLH
jgi:hypothetical protein